jgi:tRNA-guanine family transglycosylase
MADFYPAYTQRYGDYFSPEVMWWRKECLIYYPYMLICYVAKHTLSVPHRWRDALVVGRNVKVIMDSGGFQLGMGRHIDVNDVLKWEIENAVDNDILVPLDFPFLKTVVDDAEVEKRARFTANSIEKWIKAVDRAGLKVTVTVPMHGFLTKHIKIWHSYVKDFIPVTQSISLGSFAYGFRLNKESVKTILGRMMIAIDSIKHVHIFGVSSGACIAYMHLLEDMLKKVHITYDSSAYSKPLKSYKIFLPFDIYKLMTLGRYVKRRNDEMTFSEDKLAELKCHCPVCQKFFEGNLGQHATRKLYSYLNTVLSLHNLFQFIMYIDKVKALYIAGKLEEYFVKNFKEGASIMELTRSVVESGKIENDSSLMRWLY